MQYEVLSLKALCEEELVPTQGAWTCNSILLLSCEVLYAWRMIPWFSRILC